MIEYTVRPGDSMENIARRFARSPSSLLTLNAHLRTRPGRVRVGEVIRLPDVGAADPRAADVEAPASAAEGPLQVPRGQLTFDAEGQDVPGPFFSRVLHVPPGASGVTLGRGYDMKMRTPGQIERELKEAGVAAEMAAALRPASGLTGREARVFIRQRQFDGFEIGHDAQKTLFLMAYDLLSLDVQRICAKRDVVRIYGATDWSALHGHIRDVLVDLRFRGDYHSESRRRVQSPVAANDVAALRQVMADRVFWISVPEDRFERRRSYLG